MPSQSPTATDLHELVSLWNGERGTLQPVGHSRNHHLFSFRADGRDLVLRLTPQEHRDSQNVEEELAWVRYLGSHGIHVCKPVQSVTGLWVETFVSSANRPYVAMATHKALGTPMRFPAPKPEAGILFRQWGRTAARLHTLAQGFAPPSGFRRHVLDGAILTEYASRILPRSEQRVVGLLRYLWEEIRTCPIRPDSYGMVHGDLTVGNLFLIDNDIEICDFDDCGFAWFIYDIAATLHSTMVNLSRHLDFQEKLEFFMFNFFNGYGNEKRPSPFWFDRLPWFLHFYNTLVYISLFQDGGGNMNSPVRPFVETNLISRQAFDLDFTRFCTVVA